MINVKGTDLKKTKIVSTVLSVDASAISKGTVESIFKTIASTHPFVANSVDALEGLFFASQIQCPDIIMACSNAMLDLVSTGSFENFMIFDSLKQMTASHRDILDAFIKSLCGGCCPSMEWRDKFVENASIDLMITLISEECFYLPSNMSYYFFLKEILRRIEPMIEENDFPSRKRKLGSDLPIRESLWNLLRAINRSIDTKITLRPPLTTIEQDELACDGYLSKIWKSTNEVVCFSIQTLEMEGMQTNSWITIFESCQVSVNDCVFNVRLSPDHESEKKHIVTLEFVSKHCSDHIHSVYVYGKGSKSPAIEPGLQLGPGIKCFQVNYWTLDIPILLVVRGDLCSASKDE
jgi:hypothetical protein